MLGDFLTAQIFSFFLIFCRLGSALLLLPGFAETYVPARIRLTLALALSLLLTPFLAASVPPMPASAPALFLLMASEILIGLFIGTVSSIVIGATHVAGMIFSFQSGLSSAVIFDVTQQSQGSILGNFLGLTVIVLLFTTNLHHLLLHGIADSYRVFAPGHFPPLADFVEAVARLVSDTFLIAVQIAAPLIVVGTLLFLAAGVLSRLMPTMQVFFILVPPQLLIAIFILTTTFSAIVLWYLEFYRERLTTFLGYLH